MSKCRRSRTTKLSCASDPNWNNRQFTYASFGYSGSTTDLQSGNVDAQLVFANNQFVLGLANQLADAGASIGINTVWLGHHL